MSNFPSELVSLEDLEEHLKGQGIMLLGCLHKQQMRAIETGGRLVIEIQEFTKADGRFKVGFVRVDYDHKALETGERDPDKG